MEGTALALANLHLACKWRISGASFAVGTTGLIQPTTPYYCQLHKADPGKDALLAVANSGRRAALGAMVANLVTGAASNGAAVTFSSIQPTVGSAETYQAISIWGGVTGSPASGVGGGVLMMTGQLVGSANAGDDFVIPIGAIVDSYLVTG